MDFKGNIEKITLNNNYFRKVVYTNSLQQLVVMSVNTEIGEEIHKTTSQFIRIEQGKGIAYIGNNKYYLKEGDAIIIPKNTIHNVINTGETPLKLYTIYSPAHHPKNKIDKYGPE